MNMVIRGKAFDYAQCRSFCGFTTLTHFVYGKICCVIYLWAISLTVRRQPTPEAGLDPIAKAIGNGPS